jgi:hypothetical protein
MDFEFSRPRETFSAISAGESHFTCVDTPNVFSEIYLGLVPLSTSWTSKWSLAGFLFCMPFNFHSGKIRVPTFWIHDFNGTEKPPFRAIPRRERIQFWSLLFCSLRFRSGICSFCFCPSFSFQRSVEFAVEIQSHSRRSQSCFR